VVQLVDLAVLGYRSDHFSSLIHFFEFVKMPVKLFFELHLIDKFDSKMILILEVGYFHALPDEVE
jgi:hypothetical protein